MAFARQCVLVTHDMTKHLALNLKMLAFANFAVQILIMLRSEHFTDSQSAKYHSTEKPHKVIL